MKITPSDNYSNAKDVISLLIKLIYISSPHDSYFVNAPGFCSMTLDALLFINMIPYVF